MSSIVSQIKVEELIVSQTKYSLLRVVNCRTLVLGRRAESRSLALRTVSSRFVTCSVHIRCRGSTRGGLSLGPPSTCYTYICDSSTPATRTRETSFVTRLRAALVMPRVHVVVTLVSTDPAAAVLDRGRIVVVVPVLSSRSRHTGRITGMRSRRARNSGAGADGTRPHPLLGRRGPPWVARIGKAPLT
jgi:hypothetical protein